MGYHYLVRKIRSAGLSNIGRVRSDNEDAFVNDAGLGVFAVADGVGGARDGEVASAAAIASAHEEAKRRLAEIEHPASPDALMEVARQAVEAACQTVHALSKKPEHAGAATTLTLLLIDGACAAMGHVGDSRLYMLRDRKLESLSNDHSVANELLRGGFIGPEEAQRHAFRRVLSRCLGPQRSVVVDTLCVHLAPGDTFVLATDGVNEVLDDSRVAEQIVTSKDLESAAGGLIDEANARGGRDNATVVVVAVGDATKDPHALAAELLRGVAPLSGLDLAGRSRVVGAGSLRSLATGETLQAKGEPLGGLTVVLEGVLVWDGEPPSELERGDWFGAHALVGPAVSPAGVHAKTPATVLHLSDARWRKLMRRRPGLGISVLQRLAATMLEQLPEPGPQRGTPRPKRS